MDVHRLPRLGSPTLTKDRRVAVTQIPRDGVVATIADSELLDTKDPAVTLGTVKGYVRAGSGVRILAIAGPRHYTGGVWDGYDAYALVTIASLPAGPSEASATTALASCPVGDRTERRAVGRRLRDRRRERRVALAVRRGRDTVGDALHRLQRSARSEAVRRLPLPSLSSD